MSRIPDFAFWIGEHRAITIRARNEDDARSHLTEDELAKVELIEEIGKDPGLSDHDRQLLAKLGRDPGWRVLRRVAEHRMDSHFRKTARLFAHEGTAPDYPRLQWQRGVFAGMKFLLDNPQIEAKRLERLLAEEGSD